MKWLMSIEKLLEVIVGLVWSLPLIIFVIGAGVLLIIVSKGLPLRKLGRSFQIRKDQNRTTDRPGTISPYRAMATSLSGTIGLGNIAGVAVAIVKGGPGAMVWMWIIGIVGMFIRFYTCTLSVKYRKELNDGTVLGGPMQVIEQGLGNKWKPLAILFALFVIVASFGGGTMFQSNQVGAAMKFYYGIPKWVVGLTFSLFVAVVILGGIKRISDVAATVVPFMCTIYILGALAVILIHIKEIPSAFVLILKDAFTGDAVVGGALGTVINQGVRRAVFSSEVGLGSAPIGHAVAKTHNPVQQGFVAMLDPCVDILIVCTMTALVVTISGVYIGSDSTSITYFEGIIVTTEAFNQSIPWLGHMISFVIIFFAFTSMISWSYYGGQGCLYLFGKGAIRPYQIVFIIMIFVGAVWSLDPIINFSDIMFGLMVIPTLLSALLLSGRVTRMAKEYLTLQENSGEN